MINTVRNIVILGGGSSAWLTAAYLKHQNKTFNITVIDKEHGSPVGVGEGTLLSFTQFMKDCGFVESEWMPEIDATFKSGILFPGWGEEDSKIWHSFHPNKAYADGTSLHDYWTMNQDLDFKTYASGLYSVSVEHNRKIDADGCYAYHVDCSKLVKMIQRTLGDNVTLIKSEMVEVNRRQSDNFVTSLKLKDGSVIEGDLFIDCTGFKALLNHNPIRNDLTGRLICDTAIAGHIPYIDRDAELRPYVVSEAVEHGWIWDIPVSTRIGSGLVFNRNITSIDEAKDFFVQYWDNRISKDALKVIDWTPYYNDNPWHENVVAIGLSSGFIEPLESTGIFLITAGIRRLFERIHSMTFIDSDVILFNTRMKAYFEECVDFVSMHYSKSTRTGKFWDTVRDTIKISEQQKYYEQWLLDPTVPTPVFGKYDAVFVGDNWTVWLQQLGYPFAERQIGVSKERAREVLMAWKEYEDQMATTGTLHSHVFPE